MTRKSSEYPNKIEIFCSDTAVGSLLPLLKTLRSMGVLGSTREITIQDWEGVYEFDGDGSDAIGEILVNGEKR
jgi:hypothetical protein